MDASPPTIPRYERQGENLARALGKLTFGGFSINIRKAVLSGPAHGDRMFASHTNDGRTIYVFKRTDASLPTGSEIVAPTAVITSPVVFNGQAIAYSPAADEILVGEYAGGVVAFLASSNGAAVASRILRGDQTGLGWVTSLAADSARALLYVAALTGKISTFSTAFAGNTNVPPVAVLSGPLPRPANAVNSMQVDDATGTLVFQSANNILFFASAPSGNVAPRSSIGS